MNEQEKKQFEQFKEFQAQQQKPKKKNKFLIGCLSIIGIIILISACSMAMNGGDSDTSTSSSDNTTSSSSNDTNQEAKKEDDNVSREFKAALRSAQGYSDNMHMSEKGIYRQLTSQADKFPEDAAQYAIKNIKADYNKNAAETAKSYAENMDMSDDAILQQLQSDAGDGFTPEQAQYGVNHMNK